MKSGAWSSNNFLLKNCLKTFVVIYYSERNFGNDLFVAYKLLSHKDALYFIF